MAGLVPDANVGNMSSFGGDRFASDPDVAPASEPLTLGKSATIIRLFDSGKIEIENGPIADDEPPAKQSDRFDDNLAEFLSESALGQIGQDLVDGIESDMRARQDFVNNYIKGLDYLGIKMQNPGATRGRRSTAKVYHPVLQWASTKFQSSARAELLPASGPCKAVNWGKETADTDEIANDLEMDMNWYLTTGAPEYYEDMDKGLYYLGYGGTLYKKVYRCPLRQRPVSDCVFIPEMIVSPEASSLDMALRVTHDIGEMTDNEVRDLMSLGVYREVSLAPATSDDNQMRRKEREIAGTRESQDRPQDMPRRIFECYTKLDLSQYGLKEKGQPTAKQIGAQGSTDSKVGIAIPYKVSVDKDSRQVLEIRRNWKPNDKRFRRRRVFIQYGMIPGVGNLNYGYLHLLGNIAQALTALLRITIDAGMYANFPGGVRLKGARADTNEINPAPGEWASLDVPVDDIRKALMAMPYKGPDQTIFQMIEHLENLAQQLVGAVEMAVGEGKTHIPVGTMMAMIEQQTVTMQAVHKRLHTAQAKELIALKDLFAENPEDMVEMESRSGRQWTVEMFNDVSIVPASDPNVPSQVHRIMQASALATLASSQQDLYDPIKVNKRVLQAIGISDAQNYLKTPQQMQQAASQPSPEVMEKQLAAKEQQQEQQFQEQKVLSEGALRMKQLQAESTDRQADRESREKVAQMKLAGDIMKEKLQAQIQSQRDARSALQKSASF